MTQNEIQIIANRSLIALNDNRVMLPADTTEAIADFKNILRQLVNGSLVIIENIPTSPVVEGKPKSVGGTK